MKWKRPEVEKVTVYFNVLSQHSLGSDENHIFNKAPPEYKSDALMLEKLNQAAMFNFLTKHKTTH
jgi:hypothetical protein